MPTSIRLAAAALFPGVPLFSQGPGGTFAVNRQKLIDFGFRSLHVTAETAKRLIAA